MSAIRLRVQGGGSQEMRVHDAIKGKDGVTFTPSVSSAGVISWSNDGGKENPASVNIKGQNGVGVPSGGTSGQVLKKHSDTDYDTEWATPYTGVTVETVSGSTPSITGVADHRYVCGECSTLSVTAPASGCIDVMFDSGSTATVLTVTSAKSGVSAIKWANGFDPTSLDANTTYEINILDGEFGVVGSWS